MPNLRKYIPSINRAINNNTNESGQEFVNLNHYCKMVLKQDEIKFYIDDIEVLTLTKSGLVDEVNSTDTIETDTSKSAAFTKAIPALAFLKYVTFQQSVGSPIVKIGSTLGADDIMAPVAISSGTPYMCQINEAYETEKTLYISVSSGTVHVGYNYYTNYLQS